MAEQLCVLTVHAHPDDESSKGPGTIAKYASEGVRTVLVCCTGGEAGEILNPDADSEEARADLPAVRARELDAAVEIVGYHSLHKLGYRDSGMPDTEYNDHPDCFAQADIDEATGRLVKIVRAERPQVMIAYPGTDGRGHPDHIRVHEISALAFERAGDTDWYLDAGTPWQPSKLYYTGVFSPRRMRVQHEWLLARGEESPWTDRLQQMMEQPDRTTTRIDVGNYLTVGREALRAHATQVPTSGPWFRIPIEVMRELYPWEDYELARTLVDTHVPDGEIEEDLFAGIGVSVVN